MELESRILYLEDTVQSINKVMMEQQNQLDLLQNRNRFLQEKLREITEQMQETPLDQKPPHY